MSMTANPTAHQNVWQQLVYEYNVFNRTIPDLALQYFYKIAKQSNDEHLLEQVLNFLNVPRETLTLKERICYYELLKSNYTSNH